MVSKMHPENCPSQRCDGCKPRNKPLGSNGLAIPPSIDSWELRNLVRLQASNHWRKADGMASNRNFQEGEGADNMSWFIFKVARTKKYSFFFIIIKQSVKRK